MSREPLSGAERRRLRLAIDGRMRERFDLVQVPRCSGCAMPLDDFTPGCTKCWDRHRNRAFRAPTGRHVEESRHLFRVVQARFECWAIEGMRANQALMVEHNRRQAAA